MNSVLVLFEINAIIIKVNRKEIYKRKNMKKYIEYSLLLIYYRFNGSISINHTSIRPFFIILLKLINFKD